MSHSQTSLIPRLQTSVAFAIERLEQHPVASRVLAGKADALELASYYVTAHAAVTHATEFLQGSADALRRSGRSPELATLLAAKAGEESGHDAWLADDLAAIGYPLGHRNTPLPAPAARAYRDFHRSLIPVSAEAFLGTAYVLESLAIHCAGRASEQLRKSARIAGLEKQSLAGLSFLTSHAEEDQGHVAELEAVLADHLQDPESQAYVLLCAEFTATLYAQFFDRQANVAA